jgi:hypothetical protein
MLLTTSHKGCVNDPVSDYLIQVASRKQEYIQTVNLGWLNLFTFLSINITNRKCYRKYLLAEHKNHLNVEKVDSTLYKV